MPDGQGPSQHEKLRNLSRSPVIGLRPSHRAGLNQVLSVLAADCAWAHQGAEGAHGRNSLLGAHQGRSVSRYSGSGAVIGPLDLVEAA